MVAEDVDRVSQAFVVVGVNQGLKIGGGDRVSVVEVNRNVFDQPSYALVAQDDAEKATRKLVAGSHRPVVHKGSQTLADVGNQAYPCVEPLESNRLKQFRTCGTLN